MYLCLIFTPMASVVLLYSYAASAAQHVIIKTQGIPETIFSSRSDGCNAEDIPDAPARAYRSKDGVNLFAPHYTNMRLTGPSFFHLNSNCRVSYSPPADAQAPVDRSWIVSPYYYGEGRVYALAHNEYYMGSEALHCGRPGVPHCWMNYLSGVRSTNGGESFTPTSDIIISPYRATVHNNGVVGFINPSNIIELNGGYYFLSMTQSFGQQSYGNCLFKMTGDWSSPDWRAWDGNTFNIESLNPYKNEVANPDKLVCAPVGLGSINWSVSSVVRYKSTRLYLGIMSTSIGGESGFWISTSENLIDWHKPILALQLNVRSNLDCNQEGYNAYPSIIDHESSDSNYGTVGDNFYIYFVHVRLTKCQSTMDRELRRVLINISLE